MPVSGQQRGGLIQKAGGNNTDTRRNLKETSSNDQESKVH
jgi:hypothetical protein